MIAVSSAGRLYRRKSRWSAPISLQPRAPRLCDVVDAATGRPVPQTAIGFVVRPQRRYKVRVVCQAGDGEPEAVRLSACDAFHYDAGFGKQGAEERGQGEVGLATRWLDFDARGDERWLWHLRGLFSRVERLVVRLEYADGRDDYEHELPIVITPGWKLVLWSIFGVLLLAILPQAVQRLTHVEISQPLGSQVWQVLLGPNVWQAVGGLTVSLWLAITAIDRVQLWNDWRKRETPLSTEL